MTTINDVKTSANKQIRCEMIGLIIYLHLTKSTLVACRCLLMATLSALTLSLRQSRGHCCAMAATHHTTSILSSCIIITS